MKFFSIDPSQLTAEMFLDREERWLNENNPDMINSMFNSHIINQNNNSISNNPRQNEFHRNLQALQIIDLRSAIQRPSMVIRTHLFMPNRFESDFLMLETQRESNLRYILGFLVGTFLSIYTLIFLIFCKFRPKFRSGLVAGMLFGSFLFLFINLKNSRNL